MFYCLQISYLSLKRIYSAQFDQFRSCKMSPGYMKVLFMFLFELIRADNLNLIQPFIVNGTDTRIEDYPFMVKFV
jgi:hypothetical protein